MNRDTSQGGRDALVVLLMVLLGGGTAIQLVGHWLHFGSVVGAILFATLPFVAVFAASTRLTDDSDHDC